MNKKKIGLAVTIVPVRKVHMIAALKNNEMK